MKIENDRIASNVSQTKKSGAQTKKFDFSPKIRHFTKYKKNEVVRREANSSKLVPKKSYTPQTSIHRFNIQGTFSPQKRKTDSAMDKFTSP